MDADLDTLATALFVRTDDLLKDFREHAPPRPVVGSAPRITAADEGGMTATVELLWDGKPRASAVAAWKRWRPR